MPRPTLGDIPSTVEDILATANPDPDFAAAFEKRGSPPGYPGVEPAILKKIVEGHLPVLQGKLADTRPTEVVESETIVSLANGFNSRFVVCKPATADSQDAKPSPVVLLFHGGGYCLAFPETEVELARELVKAHNAIVICPSTRLAPEHPFPSPIEDGWEALRYVADELLSPHDAQRPLFPPQVDGSAGLVVGGTSSGAHLACVVSHLAKSENLSPPVTGQLLSVGGYVDASRVPQKYLPFYLSREQNKNAPIVNAEFHQKFRDVLGPDPNSSLWSPMTQGHAPDNDDGSGGVRTGNMGQPPAYFQICGMDMNRDDGLIYEKVLREECGVPTRVDLYRGYPHAFWNEYPDLTMAKKRLQDTVDGVGWLLDQSKR